MTAAPLCPHCREAIDRLEERALETSVGTVVLLACSQCATVLKVLEERSGHGSRTQQREGVIVEGRGYDEERMQATGARVGGPDVGPTMYGGGYGPWGGYGRGRGMDRPIETKPFFLTSEFFGTLLAIVAMAIAAATDDGFDARLFWILTTALVFGYVLSRGIAKSGTKSRATDPREEMRLFGGGGGGRGE